MRIYQRILSFVFILSVFFYTVALPVFAACSANESETDFGCIPNDAPGFAGKIYSIGLGLIGGIAIIFIIIGGYFILTSQGDPGKLSTGKSYISYAIIGLLLAIFGYAIVSIVGGNVLHIPGFS